MTHQLPPSPPNTQYIVGFDPNDFKNIITSGDVSHNFLQNSNIPTGCSNWDVITDIITTKEQRKVFVFGSGDQDEEYCTSAGWAVSNIHEADLIVARGTFCINDGSGKVVSKKVGVDGEEEYFRVMDEVFLVASERKVPMVSVGGDCMSSRMHVGMGCRVQRGF